MRIYLKIIWPFKCGIWAFGGYDLLWCNERDRLEALGFRGVVVVVVLGAKERFYIRIEVKPSTKAITLTIG